MTDKQKEAIMLLNSIKATPTVSGEAIMTDEQYFTLLEFIVDKPEKEYVPHVIPQVVPFEWPFPGITSPTYSPQRWEITCKKE